MIICDTILLFYDFITNCSHILTATELTKQPTTAEFISIDLCAIGCIDGQIRIWDCYNWANTKTIQSHNRGEILSIKSILTSTQFTSSGFSQQSLKGMWGGGDSTYKELKVRCLNNSLCSVFSLKIPKSH